MSDESNRLVTHHLSVFVGRVSASSKAYIPLRLVGSEVIECLIDSPL